MKIYSPDTHYSTGANIAVYDHTYTYVKYMMPGTWYHFYVIYRLVYVSGGGMNCVSCDVICVYHLWFYLCIFPGVFLSSRVVTGACPVTTDLNMRVNVRTKTCGDVGVVSRGR